MPRLRIAALSSRACTSEAMVVDPMPVSDASQTKDLKWHIRVHRGLAKILDYFSHLKAKCSLDSAICASSCGRPPITFALTTAYTASIVRWLSWGLPQRHQGATGVPVPPPHLC